MQAKMFGNGNGHPTVRNGCVFDEPNKRWITPADVAGYLKQAEQEWERQRSVREEAVLKRGRAVRRKNPKARAKPIW